jgi:hypothetical protein
LRVIDTEAGRNCTRWETPISWTDRPRGRGWGSPGLPVVLVNSLSGDVATVVLWTIVKDAGLTCAFTAVVVAS